MDRDEVAAPEEEVFGSVMRWVKADDGSRAGELGRLLTLVRFPMMAPMEVAAVEPFFMQHPLALQLMMECHPGYYAAADCRRLQPRKGQRRSGGSRDLDWMDTTDGFAGFKKLHYFPNVALAVSKTDKLEVGKVYDAPAGWHWGGRAEVAAIMGGGKWARQPLTAYYNDQGGWEGYTWGGVYRIHFVFSDSLQLGGSLAAGRGEGLVNEWAHPLDDLSRTLPDGHFAGIVCVAD